jgi:FKBP-type peptidyl-prolyl cis-trans isomerase
LNTDGTLGTRFDSNVDPQFNHVQPFQFTLGTGQVIRGWDEAFALLPVGTVGKLLIPSAMAYGSAGQGNIPPDSILLFDVTLLSAV